MCLTNFVKGTEMEENDVRMTVQLPASLKRHLKVMAAQNDRPLSKQVLHCLKVGSGWASEMEAATSNE